MNSPRKIPANARLATRSQLDEASKAVLAGIAGPGARVRDDQLVAAAALACEGRRALVVQATGWGKSAVYWMAARALRDAGAGPTLVVSPLLALMRNQVEAAKQSGLRAATLNSSNFGDWSEIMADLEAGHIDVLLTSPERLANPRFAAKVMPWLIPRLGLLVIDEAHCISSWGHDFRPDYRRIASLLAVRPEMPVLATTATANARVTMDVADQLGTDTLILRGTLARQSLHLTALPRLGIAEAFAWVDQYLPSLPGSGIIYASTVKTVTDLTRFLESLGHAVEAYHGQLDTNDREKIEENLKTNQLKAVIATSALGMGYDKPDLGFVVHVGSPGSPVDYYQQVGRAGRALETAQVVLIPTPGDEGIWQYFAKASIPKSEDAHAVLTALSAAGEAQSVPRLAAETGIRNNRIDLLVKVLAVEGAVRRVEAGWESTGQPWAYDQERYAELLVARNHEANLMRSYARSLRCLDSVLREALDDPPTEVCGRCSVCTGVFPTGLAGEPDREHVGSSLSFLRGQDVELKPRALWAPGMPWSGKIQLTRSIEIGRALAFADDPIWPEATALANAEDQLVPEWIIESIVPVLTRWKTQWATRPTLIVPVPSTRHPKLIASLAASISEVGKIPVKNVLTIKGIASDVELSAKARGAHQATRLSLIPDATVVGETVLLVDDRWQTGWTATISGALLREAGAAAVLPLVIHQRP